VFDATTGRVAMTVGAFEGVYGIAIVSADGSGFQQIVEPGQTRDQPHAGTEGPRWAPDGRILFGSNRAGGPDDWHVFAVAAAGAEPVELTGGDDGIEYNPVLSPDGSTLAYAKAVTTPDGPDPFRDAGLFVSDADGSNERQLTTTPAGAVDEWPDISPDGQWVAFNRAHAAEGGLYVIRLDGTGLRQVIQATFEPLRPRWSPDGRWIVLSSNAERNQTESANVWIVAPDGSGLRQLTHESVPGQAWAPDWSPDGEHVVFVHGPGVLDVIGLDGTPTCTLWRGTGADAGWDPDWAPPAEAAS
jgi:Tol biopolymer transport system component